MGNCQAAEAATVVIQHPAGSKVERIYWSVSAQEVMSSNPGHYVALVVASPTAKSVTGAPVKHLKLLRPDDTLLIGQVYRLINFEDVLKEFAAKKCVKLGKLLEKGGMGVDKRKLSVGSGPNPDNLHSAKVKQQVYRRGSSSGRANVRHHHQLSGGHWKPALHSIAEIGT
ncbi:hypothetical protein Acr_13g0008470 [Actinidia rufa]|uniref:DUF4228 domain-containing protein n=1 Tax=Actinidia rufa TaxID=165716 RepID=A0A7J0FNE4_9ERIC|nr:hypothetical protein Acr_13g0008470 [Actinidia rufa]